MADTDDLWSEVRVLKRLVRALLASQDTMRREHAMLADAVRALGLRVDDLAVWDDEDTAVLSPYGQIGRNGPIPPKET
jgi:hypothetical protein